jgi:NADPH:quinone reductase-like Zn-dependent oxidoreductase
MIVNAESAVKAPDALSDEEASTLPIAAVTARFSLMDYGNLPPGQTVLLQGTGVVSIFAVQIASAYGARVIATSSRDENLLKVKALGAWEGITYKQNPAWEKRALELTDGKGVDFSSRSWRKQKTYTEQATNSANRKAAATISASRHGLFLLLNLGIVNWFTTKMTALL